ncbi:D-alanyl-D-alanine carboxypeptidase/D-alanyl-D-alanine endopeptidase [Mesobacillus foraminis]|uniref:D-alanyl-D-alanine carboxypeptidase/D-alanyl-D-alanine-endopeptidase (Penicillin-binding protein 4) n=1 Tax=Mesobacillus foraminis TaxID=279826 RepID=A0A4R2BKN4_9BACI|nr:D-alanyl-D-alanine carboxypeptidase/D-alanyl-D-alanine-endopeptidase [Mesobacillus foraminis]TCN27102.1 D-alanyl-D-alanine carboxypeptidase/D-alanyl-D-alanine-endopeptidase (penicillin-binding protein 4) [Mesobacillus foraminis]
MIARWCPRKEVLVSLLITIVVLYLPAHQKFIVHAASDQTTLLERKTSLKANLDSILKDEALKGAVVGISIRSAETGEIFYSSNGDISLHPASNMKVLTAAAALEMLGPDYQFSTEVRTDGKIKGHVLYGNLFLSGKGDPTLTKTDLNSFAKELKAKGINQVKGNLISDDSWYDDVRLSQDLNWSDESNPTGAQISALTLSPDSDYDAGTVLLEITPASKAGKRADVKIIPSTDFVEIINKTRTGGPKEEENLLIERKHGTNQIKISGRIPLNAKALKSRVAVWEPSGYALDVFKHSLEENGIRLGKKIKMLNGVVPGNADLLAYKKSMPLKELFVPFMKLSNNGHGEVLAKEMGKFVSGEGTWEKGMQVIQKTVATFGVNETAILLRDGSGLSHKNLIPANELTQLLFAIQAKSWYPSFENSLPVAGEPGRLKGGTLRSRLTEAPVKGNVKAKTGSITGVSTLSGYITTQNGEKFIFAIMINNYLSPSVKSVEDQIVRALCTL